MARRDLSVEDMGEFFVVHACLRSTAEAQVKALSAAIKLDATRIEGLSRSMSFAERLMIAHHVKEDELVWPVLAERDASFKAYKNEVEEEHLALAEVLSEVMAGLLALKEAGAFVASEQGPLIAQAQKLRELLNTHLDREEEVAVPSILRHISLKEWKRMQINVMRSISVKDFAVLVPWIRATVDEELVRVFDAFLPWPILLMNRLFWEARFNKIHGPFLTALS